MVEENGEVKHIGRKCLPGKMNFAVKAVRGSDCGLRKSFVTIISLESDSNSDKQFRKKKLWWRLPES